MNKTKITRALLTARNLLTNDDDRIDLDCTRLALGNIEDALQELAKEQGEVVISCNSRRPSIEIYDTYRE